MTETRFLNVDLDLRSAVDLTDLARALEPDALTLSCRSPSQREPGRAELGRAKAEV
jgi:hypothetical protein